MLSIEECRKLIPDQEKLTDDEIVAIRKDLYEMGELALEVYFEKKRRGMPLYE